MTTPESNLYKYNNVPHDEAKKALNDIDVILQKVAPQSASSASTEQNPPLGGFFGGSSDFAPAETTSKLYTGPVLGGKKTRRHKNKRHSYSRKSKKGLKKKIKSFFGLKGGEGEGAGAGSSLPIPSPSEGSVGGTTNVKSPL